MKTAPKAFTSDIHAIQFIEREERAFNEKLKAVICELCEKPPKFIGLTGPTCSCKTTVSNMLIEYAEAHGKRIKVVSIDDFFYDTDHLQGQDPENFEDVDFDSVNALDLDLTKKVFTDIINGNTVNMPRYDFVLGKKTDYKTYEVSDYDIFLVEGIQVLYPQIYSLFPKDDFSCIFISTESDLMIGDIYFDHNEIRLLRRIVRDYHFRNASVELTFALWKGVRTNENESIFPYSHLCDYRIDSVLPFEIHVLKPYLEKILETADENEPYYPRARAIYEKIRDISGIPSDLLPEDTMYREFIPI